MSIDPVPLDRLHFFQDRVGLTSADLALVERHGRSFAERHPEFGEFFYEYFWQIPRTRMILEQGRPPRKLQYVLAEWFRRLFSEDFGPDFMQYLWNSGVRHVEVNLDQRYVNLGYCVARQFCQKVAQEALAAELRSEVTAAIDKMLDFCVLVATDSFITMTSRCDRSVIEGIAHQVRNPVTVIGGNIKRLQNQVEPDSNVYQAYERVLGENRRLERMVQDISVYNQLFQSEPQPRACDLAELAELALARLGQSWDLAQFIIERAWDPANRKVAGDPADLETMLYYLLENSLEAADRTGRRLALASRRAGHPGLVELEIFNTGEPPLASEINGLMAPFHSSKPLGTGFGLPIASLAARRNLGSLSLGPMPGGGTRCLVHLPRDLA
ncbi:MAG: protoglobin domain-containing protein [Thermodesulfobacteriota bacterium]